MHLSLVHSSIYSSYAQKNIIPAQYFRNYNNDEELGRYLNGSSFLRDINNERIGDLRGLRASAEEQQLLSGAGAAVQEGRNQTYKDNLSRVNKLVLLRFS